MADIATAATVAAKGSERTKQRTGQRETQTFRMSWLRLYAVMAFWVAAFLLIVPLGMLLLLPDSSMVLALWSPVLPVLLAALLFELVFAVALASCNPIHVNPEGIRGFDFWGRRHAMQWSEMVSVKKAMFAGLPWLIVHSHRTKNTKSALWLPLFFNDNRNFRNAVAQFAPPSCPLAQYTQ